MHTMHRNVIDAFSLNVMVTLCETLFQFCMQEECCKKTTAAPGKKVQFVKN